MTEIEKAKEKALQRYDLMRNADVAIEIRDIFKQILKNDEFFKYIDFVDPRDFTCYFSRYKNDELIIINEVAKKCYAKEYAKIFISLVGASFFIEKKIYGLLPVFSAYEIDPDQSVNLFNISENGFSFYLRGAFRDKPLFQIVFSDDESPNISFSCRKSVENEFYRIANECRINDFIKKGFYEVVNKHENEGNYFFKLFLSDKVKKPTHSDFAPVFQDYAIFKQLLSEAAVDNIIFIEFNNGKIRLIYDRCVETFPHENELIYEYDKDIRYSNPFRVDNIKSINAILSKKMLALSDEQATDDYHLKLNDSDAPALDFTSMLDDADYVIATLQNDARVILYGHTISVADDEIYYKALFFLSEHNYEIDGREIHGNYIKEVKAIEKKRYSGCRY